MAFAGKRWVDVVSCGRIESPRSLETGFISSRPGSEPKRAFVTLGSQTAIPTICRPYRPLREISGHVVSSGPGKYTVLSGKLYRLTGELTPSSPGSHIVSGGNTYRLIGENLSSYPGKSQIFYLQIYFFRYAHESDALYLSVLIVYCVSL